MKSAFEVMFPEGSSQRALLHDYSKTPEDFNRFLDGVPKEYRGLFSKPKILRGAPRPPIERITHMELTGYYKLKTNKKLPPFNFSIKLYTTDGEDFDLERADWSAVCYVTTRNRFKGWQNRNKPSQETIDDMQFLFESGYTHVAPMTNMTSGRTREGGNFFAARIDAKVIEEALVVFPEATLVIPKKAFRYSETNGVFKHDEVFAKYRFSCLSNRPAWSSCEKWTPRR